MSNRLPRAYSSLFLPAAIIILSVLASFFFYHNNHLWLLDDAAIYRKVINNILSYGRWTYNLENPTNPLTSFLYPIIIVVVSYVSRIDPKTLAPVIDSLFLGLSALGLAMFYLRRGNTVSAFASTVAVPLLLPIGNFLGMETCLVVLGFATLLAAFEHDGVRRAIAAIFPLIRPEGVVVVGVEGLYSLLRLTFSDRPRKAKQELCSLLMLPIPFLIMAAFNYFAFGFPLPRSVANKVVQGSSGFITFRDQLFPFLQGVAHDNRAWWGIAAFAPIGCVVAIRKWKCYMPVFYILTVVALWEGGIYAANTAFYDWYVVPLLIGGLVLAGCGLEEIQSLLNTISNRFSIKSSILSNTLSIALSLTALFVIRSAEVRAPESRETLYRKTAHAIKDDNKANRHVSVATIEAGHIAVELPADTYDIVDLTGLTTDNAPYYQGKDNDNFYCRVTPDYIVANLLHKAAPESRLRT